MAVTKRRARGQATTEAALGILVISTVIAFGIHFSEVAMLSLKVQEATASALWDTTGKQMSVLATDTPDFGPRTTAIQEAGPEASTRYLDFDGRTTQSRSVAPTLVFTEATPIQVTCNRDASVAPMDLSGGAEIANIFAQGVGGMVCSAQSDFSLAPGFTRRFLQNQPFRVQNATVTSYRICSPGRANGGNCQARVGIALGDWGLTTNAESNNCGIVTPGPSTTCANPGYYAMTKRAFDNMHGGSPQPPGDQLSQFVWKNMRRGGPQIDLDENAFFMASIGEDGTPDAYKTDLTEHQGAGPYIVTPGGNKYDDTALLPYFQAAQQRDLCAFGLPCSAGAWPQYQ